jgi:hypothetical protein
MSCSGSSTHIPKLLWILLVTYCCASLLHFVHNAEFVGDYPNLPVWLTRSKVYLAWFAIATVGVVGVLLLKLGLRTLGFLFIAGYAALGFAGLDHYWVAPISAHTLAMNATIGFEVAAAAVLFALAIVLLFQSWRPLARTETDA